MASCGGPDHALLLSLRASGPVALLDLRVRDARDQALLLNERDVVIPAESRDITPAGTALPVAIMFEAPGDYLVWVLARHGDGKRHVALRKFELNGIVRATLRLLELSPQLDRDGDGVPGCGTIASCDGLAGSLDCEAIDCNDDDPLSHPFAQESCGNETDEDCSAGCSGEPGEGDQACADADGDGSSERDDCDDDDPCRAPSIVEAPNLCGRQPTAFSLPEACRKKLEAQGLALSAPFCGDGVDQDCNGSDAPCVIDADCDGVASGADCDETDASIPRDREICDNGRDDNCNDVVDEGCASCDVDGDGHAAIGATHTDCPAPPDDRDDFDAGIGPHASDESQGGVEGGTVITALRQFCASTLNKDGTPERNIDHDQDGRAAAQDGCPPVECDGDGDGFAGAQCSPTRDELDCDDGDARVFPGAPDRCGDEVAQNCLSVTLCDDDADGDNYEAPDDCDDKDATVHPWATELCDGRDNDCDGLVDEGNPDINGVLVQPHNRCNERNKGRCAALTGSCACTKTAPDRATAEDRTACPGERVGAEGAAQRCLNAVQPQLERCEPGDFDCDGQEGAPAGKAFADAGRACSVDVGSCRMGRVVGCDLSRELPYAATVSAILGGAVNTHWICEGAVLPQPEQCNGLDDDCDGQPLDRETDDDGDGLSECAGDCDDTNPNIRPGADFGTQPRRDGSFDLNCDGRVDPLYTTTVDCDVSCRGEGWAGGLPSCGTTGTWRECDRDCRLFDCDCDEDDRSLTQRCR